MYRIKEIRKKKNLTQEQLSEISGVSRSLINQLETGTAKSTTTETLRRLANALDCEMTDFFSSESLND